MAVINTWRGISARRKCRRPGGAVGAPAHDQAAPVKTGKRAYRPSMTPPRGDTAGDAAGDDDGARAQARELAAAWRCVTGTGPLPLARALRSAQDVAWASVACAGPGAALPCSLLVLTHDRRAGGGGPSGDSSLVELDGDGPVSARLLPLVLGHLARAAVLVESARTRGLDDTWREHVYVLAADGEGRARVARAEVCRDDAGNAALGAWAVLAGELAADLVPERLRGALALVERAGLSAN